MADAVVIGGGIVGVSCAVHLRQAGLGHVVLVDAAGELGAGTTAAGAGFVAYWAGGREADLADYAIEFYGRVAETVGCDLGIRKTGMMLPVLGDHDEQLIRGIYEQERAYSEHVEWLDNTQAEALFPLFAPGSVRAALLQSRAHQVPIDKMMAALGEVMLAEGVDLRLGVRVHGVERGADQVSGVITDSGTIPTGLVVNAAGAWAHALASRDDVSIGAVPLLESRYVTNPSPGITDDLPMVLLFDRNLLYLRPERGGLLVGAIESEVPPASRIPLHEPPEVAALSEHAVEHHETLARRSADVVPVLATLAAVSKSSGMPTFTPDGQHVLGEAPQLTGYFVAAGCNEAGVSHAPGLGRLLAELVTTGETKTDISDFRVGRFAGLSEDDLIDAAVSTYLARHG